MPSSQPRLPKPVAEEEVEFRVPANPRASVRLAQERVPRVRWRRCWFDQAPKRYFPLRLVGPLRDAAPEAVLAQHPGKDGDEVAP